MSRGTGVASNEALMFVYGTLRPGEANYWIEPIVKWYVDGCTTKGQLFYQVGGGYPVADFNLPGEVIGTLLCLATDMVWAEDKRRQRSPQTIYGQARAMELGAGYQSRQVKVILPGDLGTRRAEAWHYNTTRYRPGPLIEGGDWKHRQQWRPPSVGPGRREWWEDVGDTVR